MMHLMLISLLLFIPAARAAGVQPVFDPNGASFYDLPFPHELRRDPDGTISLASFPGQENPLVALYLEAIEETDGFGLNSGFFFKFDGAIDETSLPADPEASRETGASLFLMNIDERSRGRGERWPLWTEFRETGDAYRDALLLGGMPVPGHPLDPGTLYAVVITDSLLGEGGAAVETAPLIQRMKNETPQGAFESEALPLYRRLSIDDLVAIERLIRRKYRSPGANLSWIQSPFTDSCWLFTGDVVSPQFQTGTPPFIAPGSGRIIRDNKGVPIVQREDTLEFVLCVPKETTDGSIRMPRSGWPVVQHMHGTGGNRFSHFSYNGPADRLAMLGVASIGIDQPKHGLRPGAGSEISQYLFPFDQRNDKRQSAADSLRVHQLLKKLRVDPSLITVQPGAGFVAPIREIRFDKRRRLFMGHSQGAITGALFLGVAKRVRGGVLSGGGGHFILNALTREEDAAPGITLQTLLESVLGGPIDLFHPVLHGLQTFFEVSEELSYAPFYRTKRKGRPLSLLFTHGHLDGYLTTPMLASLVAAARYPLIGPVFPARSFPRLPGYSYQEAFDLAGLPSQGAPVSGNIVKRVGRPGTGGMVQFPDWGHFPVFFNPDAIEQWTEFMRSLAYERVPVIPQVRDVVAVFEDLSPCEPPAVDRWEFDVRAGDQLSVRATTIDSLTMADLCFSGTCAGLAFSGDDDVACPLSDQFDCPWTEFLVDADARCWIDVTVCAGGCTGVARAGYWLEVRGSSTPVLDLVMDDF
jgi:hypothetical protein